MVGENDDEVGPWEFTFNIRFPNHPDDLYPAKAYYSLNVNDTNVQAMQTFLESWHIEVLVK